MRFLHFLAFTLAAAGGALPIAFAAEEVADDKSKSPEAVQRFDRTIDVLKAHLKQMNDLAASISDANADEKPRLESKYRDLLNKAEALEGELEKAAEKAVAVEPDKEKDHTNYLLYFAEKNIRSDRYEDALRQIDLLMEKKLDRRPLRLFAVKAAFALNDFDLAARRLAAATKDGALTREDQAVLQNIDADELKKYRDMWKKESAIRAAEKKADDLPRVKLETSKGDIVIELFENEAPNTVANFISLIEAKKYDGLVFHRVLAGFMAQGGDPKGDGTGGPGYHIPCECHEDNYRRHFRGTLSMAHGGRDTGGSQFFITFLPTGHLDGRHTAFGRVIEGLDVLAKLNRVQPGRPGDPDKIVKATVVRKRDHAYKPVTLPATR